MAEGHGVQGMSEIRLLTFKKWNLPYTASVCDVGDEYGEYVSYQDNHFIDIQPISETAVGQLHAVYDQLTENRAVQSRAVPPVDIHTIQCMPLVGPRTDFWDSSPPVLYISLIQLTNRCVDDFPTLEEKILECVRNEGGSNTALRCTLYESLDFCDLVLFTTGIELGTLQKCLWTLTLGSDDPGVESIRDAISFCCFRRQFLRQVFDGAGTDAWKDTLSLSVDLNIQSLDRWNILQQELAEIDSGGIVGTLGRHDVRLTYSQISSQTVLQILSKIDSLCRKSNPGETEEERLSRAFGSCNITVFSELTGDMAVGGGAQVDTALYCAVKRAMEQWHENQESHAYDTSRVYIEDTFSALLTLSKSGFADEFVVSVLPTLQSYIVLLNEVFQQENLNTFKAKVTSVPQIYFRALNTLALCTMHSERQFIQSPAFHATYFDIPPKLLSFYTALTDSIIRALSAQEGKRYRFLLVPDYRDDIVVTQLEIDTKRDTNEHLAVVSLQEDLFYNPVKAIGVLCHEIAHYVGDRQREQRAEYIFQAVGVHLLKNTFPFSGSLSNRGFGDSLLELLSQGFSDYMKTRIDLADSGARREIQYILQGVSDFLDKTDYGYALFCDQNCSAQLGNRWRSQLIEKLSAGDVQIKEDFSHAVEKIKNTLSSELFAEDVCATEYTVDVFVRALLSDLYHIKDGWQLKEAWGGTRIWTEFVGSCQNIIQAFSEAYADFRMLSLLKNCISKELYLQFLGVGGETDDTQLLLRCHAIYLSGVFPEADVSELPGFGDDGEIYEIAAELIARYLQGFSDHVCENTCAKKLRDTFLTFCCGTAPMQVRQIRNTTMGYRKALIDG